MRIKYTEKEVLKIVEAQAISDVRGAKRATSSRIEIDIFINKDRKIKPEASLNGIVVVIEK